MPQVSFKLTELHSSPEKTCRGWVLVLPGALCSTFGTKKCTRPHPPPPPPCARPARGLPTDAPKAPALRHAGPRAEGDAQTVCGAFPASPPQAPPRGKIKGIWGNRRKCGATGAAVGKGMGRKGIAAPQALLRRRMTKSTWPSTQKAHMQKRFHLVTVGGHCIHRATSPPP
eukprot:gene9183-biopygen9239